MKQSKVTKGDLKPEHQWRSKTTNGTILWMHSLYSYKNICEDPQEVPQSQSTTLIWYQKKHIETFVLLMYTALNN